MNEKIFADGLMVKRHENAPDFVTCSLSIRVSEFIYFLQQHQDKDWVNVQVKLSKNGKYYAELDTWKPNPKDVHDRGMEQARDALDNSVPADSIADDDIPF